MTNKTPHRSSKNNYPLFNGKVTSNRPAGLKARQDFIRTFPERWEKSSSDKRVKLIRYTSELPPEDGIYLVFSGMEDFTRDVKLETKKALSVLADKITIKADRVISKLTAIKSETFAKRIFIEMSNTISLDEIRLYLSILLTIGGRGPFFAWKYFINTSIPPNIFIDTLNKLPEKLRLGFVQYYFNAEVSEKRKHAATIKNLLKGIKNSDEVTDFIVNVMENPTDCRHANIALGGDILISLMHDNIKIEERLKKDPAKQNDTEKIKNVKIAGIMDNTDILSNFLSLLDISESRKVRLVCINALGNSNGSKDPRIKNGLLQLVDDEDQYIIINTLKALIKLEVPDIVNIAYQIIINQKAIRAKLYKCLCYMKAEQLVLVLDKLDEPLATDARRTIGTILIKRNPERLEVLLEYHKSNAESKAFHAAEVLYNKIKYIKQKEPDDLCEKYIPDSYLASLRIQKLIKKQPVAKQIKKLMQLVRQDTEIEMKLHEEFFHDIDITGIKIENADLNGSAFLNSDLSSVYFKNVNLKNVRFENTSLQNAEFENVVFDNCVFKNIDAHAARFTSSSFINTSICDSSFEFAEMPDAYFTGATIIKCNFSRTELSFASFTGAQLFLSDFKYSSLFQTEFSYSKGILCDYSETNMYEVAKFEHSDLNARLKEWRKIKLPKIFYDKELLETKWLNILILTNEMDSQRDIFLKYNRRRKECTLDAFKPAQEDLFEIIPLLLHLTQHLIPIEKQDDTDLLLENNSLKNISSGLYGYVPTQKTVKLAKKYLNCDTLRLLPGKKAYIEALFTIGSLGTIAQSSVSDIDFWVCINKSTMAPDAVSLLSLKLRAIEKWVKAKFDTELHFFVVDAQSVRCGNFGGSDFESSGSAQGMILKEEFYRTMILIAGKIPFWCVLPVWAADKYYNLLYLIANRFYNDYLDFGNVSSIPLGEYFGASMWQLFKGLTSPYKSVMKMALLENYIEAEKNSGLLCNRLKKRWASGKCDFSAQDPYLMLFEEITAFYSKSNQKEIRSLVRLCFFFKLGIRSINDLDKSVFKIRKILVQRCIENFAWEESMLCELGHFNEWSFEKVSELSIMINNFMIETYRKLGKQLNTDHDSKTMITNQDITILGRKMFVHFVPQPYKIGKLPHVAKGRKLFNRLYIFYRQTPKKKPTWEVFHEQDKNDCYAGNEKAILKGIEHIEEVAAWIIRNNLLKAGTIFNILPNPTFVSAQDFNELIDEMNSFFVPDEINSIPSSAFLEQYKAQQLYVIVNFSDHRKANKIFEYVAVYLTTWGEVFCHAYRSKEGLNSISDAIDKISNNLNLSLKETTIGHHVPKMSRKRIKKSND